MGKRGRKSALLEGLDAATRQQLDEAIVSGARERVADLYRRFALAQHEVSFRSFYHYCSVARREQPAASLPPTQGDGAIGRSDPWALLDLIGRAQLSCINAGDLKSLPHLAAASKAQTDLLRLDIEKQVEKRAEEIHGVRLNEFQGRLKQVVNEKAEGGAKALTSQDVYGLIDDVIRGKA